MTLQEIFNKVRAHLLKQNQRCITASSQFNPPTMCRYRHDELRCAIGILIPDDMYHPDFEANDIVNLLRKSPEFCNLLGLPKYQRAHSNFLKKIDWDKIHLLKQLQDIHDSRPVHSWRVELKYLAEHFNLHLEEI